VHRWQDHAPYLRAGARTGPAARRQRMGRRERGQPGPGRRGCEVERDRGDPRVARDARDQGSHGEHRRRRLPAQNRPAIIDKGAHYCCAQGQPAAAAPRGGELLRRRARQRGRAAAPPERRQGARTARGTSCVDE
jgi:hypothetical protein